MKGFTLIEILVVVAIVIMIFGFSSFINFSSYNHTFINTEVSTLISVLSKARSQAMNNVDHVAHGVHIATDTYTLFEGTSFIAGASNNEDIPKNSKTSISEVTDIYFNQLSGNPSATPIITLSDGVNTRTIDIKTGGLIDW